MADKIYYIQGPQGEQGEQGPQGDSLSWSTMTEAEQAEVQENLCSVYTKYTGTATLAVGEWECTIPISQYTAGVGTLDVYATGLHIIEGTDYTLNGNTFRMSTPAVYDDIELQFVYVKAMTDSLHEITLNKTFNRATVTQAVDMAVNDIVEYTLNASDFTTGVLPDTIKSIYTSTLSSAPGTLPLSIVGWSTATNNTVMYVWIANFSGTALEANVRVTVNGYDLSLTV